MFLDPRGLQLLHVEPFSDPRVAIDRNRVDLRSYLRLVAAHPLFFTSAYARHIFNGLDIAYPTPYVTRLALRSMPFALVNYLMLGVALVGAVTFSRRIRVREDAWRLSVLAVFAMPAFVAIPTAVEPRFLLPLWMLACGLAAFRPTPDQRPSALERMSLVLPVLALVVIACFILATATYSRIYDAPARYATWCLWC
jgi:hypothetical protein